MGRPHAPPSVMRHLAGLVLLLTAAGAAASLTDGVGAVATTPAPVLPSQHKLAPPSTHVDESEVDPPRMVVLSDCSSYGKAMIHTVQSILVALTILVMLEGYIMIAIAGVCHWRHSKRGTSRGEEPAGDPSRIPSVLVQLPMYNEKECCRSAIAAAAALHWPGRIEVQVLDDSSDPEAVAAVNSAVEEFRARGHSISLVRRSTRSGFKAGALVEGLEVLAVPCDFCAVLDADFLPQTDFLLRHEEKLMPHIRHNSNVAFVQARWAYSNASYSYLTRFQEMALDYHFKCEQLAQAAGGMFFNFNGSAVVLRTQAIMDVGGWGTDSTVEDTELSMRFFLGGWKGAYVDSVTCESELPSTMKAWRTQQYRWTAGPADIARRMAPQVISCGHLRFARKVYTVLFSLLARRIVAPMLGALWMALLALMAWDWRSVIACPGIPPAIVWGVMSCAYAKVIAASLFSLPGPLRPCVRQLTKPRSLGGWLYALLRLPVLMLGHVFDVLALVAFDMATSFFKCRAAMAGAVGGKNATTFWVVTDKKG